MRVERNIFQMAKLYAEPAAPICVLIETSTVIKPDPPLDSYPPILQARILEAERLLERIEEVEKEWDTPPPRFVYKL